MKKTCILVRSEEAMWDNIARFELPNITYKCGDIINNPVFKQLKVVRVENDTVIAIVNTEKINQNEYKYVLINDKNEFCYGECEGIGKDLLDAEMFIDEEDADRFKWHNKEYSDFKIVPVRITYELNP